MASEPAKYPGHPSSGGETGKLIRTKKWEQSPLGAIDAWPAPLRTHLGFILNARFPMFLLWGSELLFFYNDEWHESFNTEKGHALLGAPAEKVFAGVWDAIKPTVDKIMQGDESAAGADIAVPVPGIDKAVSAWSLSFCPVYDTGGGVCGAMAMVNEHSSHDVYTLDENRNGSEDSSMLRSITQSSNDAIIGMSTEGIITSWNRAAERIFGYPAAEMIGQEADRMLPPHKVQEEEYIASRIKRGEKTEGLVTQRLTRDNRLVDIALSVSPLFDAQGHFTGVSKIARDITSQKRHEQIITENEERLQLLLNASELGTWELDLLNNQIRYSHKYLEILGYTEYRELSHDELLRHVHPGDMRVREAAMKSAMSTGLLNYEFRLIWEDGSVHWTEARGHVFYNEKKEPVKLIGIFRDVTERRTRVDELRESERKFRILADSVPQLIWTSDTTGNLNYFNLSFFEYSGLTPKQIHKEGWIQIVHPDDRLESVKLWAQSIDEGRPFLTEHRFRRTDGEYRWHLSRALPQKDSKGVTQMWVGTSTDVHDQKTVSEDLEKSVELRTSELKKAVDELTKTNQELEQFAYVSSHDLQEPLRKIQTFSGILSGKLDDNAESKVYLDKINSSAFRMSELITDLLDYSRLSKTDAIYTGTDLNEILEKVKSDFEVMIQQKKAIILGSRLPVVKAIPIQMNQLIYNLVSNALKFCDRKPFIEVSAKKATPFELKKIASLNPDGNYHHLMFKDNGIGFSQEYSEQIFTIFQRLNDVHTYSGTGIGLAMCKKIMENHGGFINAESEPGKGSTFNVFLPY